MDKKYIVKVNDINNDDIILSLLEFGSVDHVSQHTNVCTMTIDSRRVKELKQCNGVLSVRESQLGKWLDGLRVKEGANNGIDRRRNSDFEICSKEK